jgi:dipeptidyl aminopeptidase/acylaminoacyl peptidase
VRTVTTVVVLLATLVVASARAAAPEPTGWITFSLLPDVETGIGVVRPDGSGRKVITPRHSGGRWSPDGSRLVASGYDGLSVLDRRGRVLRILRAGDARLFLPSWSPSGGRVAALGERCAAAGRDSWCADLWLLRADGRGARLLVTAGVLDDLYAWSRDGLTIAYSGSTVSALEGRPSDPGIVLVSVRNGRTAAPSAFVGASEPSWSPGGRRIAFTRRDDSGRTDVYFARRDGSGLRRLTRDGRSSLPSWSPDGRSLAFLSRLRGPNTYLVVVASVALNTERHVAVVGRQPRLIWSPDSRWLAWSDFDERQGQDFVFVARADGRGSPKAVTAGVDPDWR